MIPLSYIDLHCDTALELYLQNKDIAHNDLAISLESAAAYARYLQCYAIFSSHSLSDEDCYRQFLAASAYFREQIQANYPGLCQIETREELEAFWRDGRCGAILAVEDARLLAGKPERIETLADRGVRYMTLTWSGETIIGGSHNTETGLTAFGREVVEGCFASGIFPDISHASAQTATDVLSLAERAGKPILATHSDAYGVCSHTRNLRDGHFKQIRDLGGLVGINLFVDHLGSGTPEPVSVDTILRHIDYYLCAGGEHTIALGGDLDGAALPNGFSTVADVRKIADALASRGYGQELIDGLFWKNAYRFFAANLPASTSK